MSRTSLTAEEVKAIKIALGQGITRKHLAQRYGVSVDTIRLVGAPSYQPDRLPSGRKRP